MKRGRSPLRRPTGPWEFILGLLALLSIGIFLLPYLDAVRATPPQALLDNVVVVDVSICVVFIADYLFRMGRHGQPLSFARENFFQPLAMIPLSTPIINDVQVFMLLILAARFIRAYNVVFGQSAFQSILHRYSGFLAREISDAVLIRSLATAREVTKRGRFAKSVADALDRRRGELHAIVALSLARIPAWDAFIKIPGTGDLVAKGEDLVVDALLETLRSDRLNILVANVIDDSLEDFKRALDDKHPGLAVDALGPDSEGRSFAGPGVS